MAVAWDDARLHWIVPARRAVVRKKIGLADAADAWAAQLEHYKDVLRRWYGGQGAFALDDAVKALRDWVAHSVRARTVDAARDKPATVDLAEQPFYPRLWKGPLRVVQEAAGAALDGAPQQDAEKAVSNADAVLRMGDVVEFPLHKLLVKCGKTDYSAVTFDPDGSFFLGTAVKGSTADKTPLHDNAAAMRLQLIIGLGKGAFYGPDPTWTKDPGEPPMPQGKDDGLAVYARGMPYAGTLVSPGSHDEGWKVQNYHWGTNDKGSTNLPMFRPGQSPSFPDDQPLTPGWTCSPFTLFISQYLLGARGGKKSSNRLLFDGGVRTTYTEHTKLGLPIHRHYEYLSWQTFAGAPSLVAQSAETTEVVSALRTKLEEAIGDLSGESLLSGSGLSEATQERVEKYASGKKADPKALSAAVAVMVESASGSKHAAPDADKEPLRKFHAAWMERVVAFPTGAWPDIKGDGGWAAVGKKAPKVSTQSWPGPCPEEGCSKDHAGMKAVKAALKELKKALGALPASGEGAVGFDGRSALHADFSEALGDVNVVILNGHEYAIIKVWPHEDLMKETALPRTAALAGYHPLTGTPITTADGVPANGQLYVMDATGSYWTWKPDKDTSRQVFRTPPWRATVIDGNRMLLSYSKKSAEVKALTVKKAKQIWIGEYRGGKAHPRFHKPFEAMLRLLPGGAEEIGRAYLRSATYADLKWHKIYLIFTSGKKKGDSPPETDSWYAERALPYGTQAEVASGYPTLAEAQKVGDDMAAEAYASDDVKPKGSSKSAWAWAWFASNMANPNKDKQPAAGDDDADASGGDADTAQPDPGAGP